MKPSTGLSMCMMQSFGNILFFYKSLQVSLIIDWGTHLLFLWSLIKHHSYIAKT